MSVFNLQAEWMTVLNAHIHSIAAMFRESVRACVELIYGIVAGATFLCLMILDPSSTNSSGWVTELILNYIRALVWPVYLLLP